MCLSRIEIKSTWRALPLTLLSKILNENQSSDKIRLLNEANQWNRRTLCWNGWLIRPKTDAEQIQSGFQFNLFRCVHLLIWTLKNERKFRHSFWWARNWQITEKITRNCSGYERERESGEWRTRLWPNDTEIEAFLHHALNGDTQSVLITVFLLVSIKEPQGPLWGVYVIYSVNFSA